MGTYLSCKNLCSPKVIVKDKKLSKFLAQEDIYHDLNIENFLKADKDFSDLKEEAVKVVKYKAPSGLRKCDNLVESNNLQDVDWDIVKGMDPDADQKRLILAHSQFGNS